MQHIPSPSPPRDPEVQPSGILDPAAARVLADGCVIPAHPLALTDARALDERRQRALTRYYCDAGAGGIAVGVHTTQFAIRKVGLFAPVLTLAVETIASWERANGRRVIRIAGVCGSTTQAVSEAALARDLGYDAGLLSLAALAGAPEESLLAHCRSVAEVLPVMGFYLQPAVGGPPLSYGFWRALFDSPRVVAVKIAPFNRYQTVDVLRAIADSGRTDLAAYTGNDDNIVADLLTMYEAPDGRRVPMVGGLLGQWAVWTQTAVALLDEIKRARRDPSRIPALLASGARLTDANAAIFDAAHGFAGCIAGVHEVLRRQGLMAGRWCLDPSEDVSPGQSEAIDRVLRSYPELTDDTFVRSRSAAWLRD
jgi:dihydrodipicolinate synthase/N-acetylneuraminate lyase